MCTQDCINYQCGCRKKTEFRQCDEKYDAGVSLRCANTEEKELQSRNYCRDHLLEGGKGEVMYSTRRRRGGSGGA